MNNESFKILGDMIIRFLANDIKLHKKTNTNNELVLLVLSV